MPAKYEIKILGFQKSVTAARKKSCFELGQNGNMGRVSLTFNVPLDRTVDTKGAKLIIIKTSGCEKTHYIATLGCCAEGTKLPLLLIFKQNVMLRDKIL
jgi:hypothetical protein